MKSEIQNLKSKIINLCLLFAFAAIPAQAERPFKTDDPYQIGLYRWEVFGGISIGTGSRGGTTHRNDVSLNTGFDYGITERSEIGLSGDIFKLISPGDVGIGDAVLHYKHRVNEANASMPDIAVDFRLKIPTASSTRGLGSGRADFGLIGLFGFTSASELWRTTARLGYVYTGGLNEESRVEVGLATRYTVREGVLYLAELYYDTNERPHEPGRAEASLGAGIDIGHQTVLDFMLTAGLSKSVSAVSVRAGVTSKL